MASSLAPVIRPEGPEDYSAIADVVREAFGSETEVELVEAIRRLPGYRPDLALIAAIAGRIVGHVMISGVSLHDREERHEVVTLSPLAVSPICQGHGIGSVLVNEALRRADAAGEPVVVLEGSPRYYRRFGFEAAADYGIQIDLPSWAPPQAAQVIRLSGYKPSIHGRLVFAALDQVSHSK